MNSWTRRRPTQQGQSVKPWLLKPLCTALCLAGVHYNALALPGGAQTIAGQVTVQGRSPTQLEITQGTPTGIVNWQNFSIAAGESVRILQPGRTSVLLNRVVGTDPSLILGSLSANGKVFLLNPHGILFGQGAQINAGSFVASTLGMTDHDFLTGNYQLQADPAGAGNLTANGSIVAADGTVVLAAPMLTMGGTIDAHRVGLGAGSGMKIDVDGDGLIFLNVRNDGLAARLDLLGRIRADGGTAELAAQARAGFAGNVLNLDGVVQARSLGLRNGQVVINGGNSGITAVSGTIDVTGTQAGEHGGSATLLGQNLGLTGTALVDASGAAGGGTVLLGGTAHGTGPLSNSDYTLVLGGARVKADATQAGDGGQVVVWSERGTAFSGALSAQAAGPAGNGGMAEISSRGALDLQGSVRLDGTGGRVGSLLLDPTNLTVVAAGNVSINAGVVNLTFSNATLTDAFVNATTVANTLNASTSVSLQATNNLSVLSPIATTSGNGNLSLQAGNSINLAANITLNAGTISVTAHDNTVVAANNPGTLTVQPNVTLSTADAILLSGNTLSFGANSSVQAGTNATLTSTGTAALVLPNISAGNTLTVSAQGSISQAAGTVVNANAASLDASGVANSSITLNASGNLFGTAGVSVQTTGSGGNVTLVAASDVALDTSNVGGVLTVSTPGNISQVGALTLNADGNQVASSGTNRTISLSNTSNSFGANSVAFNTTGANAAVSVNSDQLVLGASNIGGNLTATARTGNITQSGALSLGANGSDFTTSSANQTITLTAANLFGANSVGFHTSGAAATVNVSADQLVLGTSTIGGRLDATTTNASTGAISQVGALALGASGSQFTAAANQAITLENASNTFGANSVAFNTTGAAGNVSVVSNQLVLGASNISGTLTANATNASGTGDISQTGSLTTLTEGSTFSVSGNHSILLGSADNALAGVANGTDTFNVGGNFDLRNHDAVLLTGYTLNGSIHVRSTTGNISQNNPLTLGAGGSSSFTTDAANKTIVLNDTANLFSNNSLAFNTSGTAANVVVRGDQLVFGTSNVGGNLDVLVNASTGNISQTGGVTTGTDGSKFIVTGTHSILLGSAENSLAGVANGTDIFSVGGSLALWNRQSILLTSSAGALTGNLRLRSSTGSISQNSSLSVGTNGSSFQTDAAGQTINLSDTGNTFSGQTAAFVTTGNAGHVDVSADQLVFASSSVGGHLTAAASSGNISQTGLITLGASGSSFTTLANTASINLASNNSFGANSVAFNTDGTAGAGQVSVNSDQLVLATSNVGGALTAVARTGTLTQAGVLTLGADGNHFTTANASGRAITLTQNNAFGGHDLAFSTANSSGNVSVTGDTLVFAASSIGGNLVAAANAGNISQTGLLVLGANGSNFTTTQANATVNLSLNNSFSGNSVAFNTNGPAADVTVNSNQLVLGASNVGGAITATARTGNISQTANAPLSLGANGSQFVASTANASISLTQANQFGGHDVAFSTTGATGNVTVAADTLVLAGSGIGGNLVATAGNGNISQSGVLSLGAAGSSFTTSNAGAVIDLALNNTFGGNSVAFSTNGTGGNVSVSSDRLVFGASSVGGALTATARIGTINQTGAIALGGNGSSFTTSAANQAITLLSANNFGNHSVVFNTSNAGASVNVNSDQLLLAASTIGGNLTVTARTGNITELASLTLGTTGNSFTTLTNDSVIDLSANNTFGANSVAFSTAGNGSTVTVNSDALVLGTSNIGGTLAATARTGNISQSGLLSLGASGSTFTTQGNGSSIALALNNSFGNSAVAFSTQGPAGDVTVNSDQLVLAASSVGGNFSATARTAGIAQAGVLTLNGSAASFSTLANGGVALTQNNTFGNAALAFNTSGTAGNVSVSGDQLLLAASSISGNLRATARTGNISQSGALTVGANGNSFATLATNSAITLNASNTFGNHDVAFSTLGAAGNLQVTSDQLVFAGSGVGGTVTANATSGNISQTGALTTGTTGSTFSVAAGQSILLGNAANSLAGLATGTDTFNVSGSLALGNNQSILLTGYGLSGNLTVVSANGSISQNAAIAVNASGSSFTTSAAGQSVTLLSDNHFGANSVSFNTNGTAGNVSVNSDQLVFGTSTVGGALTAVARTGAISDAGTVALGANGSSFTTLAVNQSITLTAPHAFGANSVSFSTTGSAGNVSVSSDQLVLGTSSVGGTVSATARTGNLSEVGTLTVGGTGNLFNTQGAGKAITLAANNSFGANTVAFSTAVGGNVDVNSDQLVFAASSVGGHLVANARSGDITQTGALSTGADGSSFTVSNGRSIDLSSQANHLSGLARGQDAFAGEANLAVRNVEAIQLGATSTSGNLSLHSDAGAVTVTGNFTAGGTLNLQGTDLSFAPTVVLRSGGAMTLADTGPGTDLVLPTVVTQGNLSVTSSTASGISQGGSITASGTTNQFTTTAANATIALTNPANTFGNGSVALTTAGALGDASISADSVQLADLAVGGSFTANTSGVAGLSQLANAALSVGGTSQLTATTGSVLLANAGNQFAGAVTAAAAGSVYITNAGGLNLGVTTANTTQAIALGGNLLVTGNAGATAAQTSGVLTLGGNFSSVNATAVNLINQSAAVTLTGPTNFTVTANNGSIALTDAGNVFGGNVVTVHTSGSQANVSLTADHLVLGDSQVGGALQVVTTGTAGGISQVNASTLAVQGPTVLTAGSGGIQLTSATNQFGGNVSAVAPSLINLAASGALTLQATTSNGAVSATADALVLNDSAASTVASTRPANANSSGNMTLSGSGGLLTLNAGGSANVQGDNGLQFATSNVAGALVATALGGNISQTGAITTGADGSQFTTRNANASIQLASQANSFGTHGVGLETAQDAAIRSDSLNLATSSVGGALLATTTAGILKNSGVLTVRGNGSVFTAAPGQSIDLTSARNSFAGRDLQLSTSGAGNAAVALDQAVLAPSTVGGDLRLDATGGFTQTGAVTAGSVHYQLGGDVQLGALTVSQGGSISGNNLILGGNLQVNGGTLVLNANASPDSVPTLANAGTLLPTPPLVNNLALVPGLAARLTVARDTVNQTAGNISVAANGTLQVRAAGGSVSLDQAGNQFIGGLAVLSAVPVGNAPAAYNTPWTSGHAQSLVSVTGTSVTLTAPGIEADLVHLRADQASTQGGARLAARLPYDSFASGTATSEPAMVLDLAPGALNSLFPFGSGPSPLQVAAGAYSIGGRTSGPNAGYITVKPKNGAQGSLVVFLAGPDVGTSQTGYAFFYDGAGLQTQIPVFYNGVLPKTPQLNGALSSVAAVSEEARRERFEETVRTENVAIRLRRAVISEVGPGRPATTGTEGAAPPESCAPGVGLACGAGGGN